MSSRPAIGPAAVRAGTAYGLRRHPTAVGQVDVQRRRRRRQNVRVPCTRGAVVELRTFRGQRNDVGKSVGGTVARAQLVEVSVWGGGVL